MTKRILETIEIISPMVREEIHIVLLETAVLSGAIVMHFLSPELMLVRGRVQEIVLRSNRLGKLSINSRFNLFLFFILDELNLVYFINPMAQEETPM